MDSGSAVTDPSGPAVGLLRGRRGGVGVFLVAFLSFAIPFWGQAVVLPRVRFSCGPPFRQIGRDSAGQRNASVARSD